MQGEHRREGEDAPCSDRVERGDQEDHDRREGQHPDRAPLPPGSEGHATADGGDRRPGDRCLGLDQEGVGADQSSDDEARGGRRDAPSLEEPRRRSAENRQVEAGDGDQMSESARCEGLLELGVVRGVPTEEHGDQEGPRLGRR